MKIFGCDNIISIVDDNGLLVHSQFINMTTITETIVKKVNDDFTHHVLHNDNGPARFIYSKDYTEIEWYFNSHYHNLTGPAYIKYDKEGNKITEHWYRYGYLDNPNGPAMIDYLDNGVRETFYRNGCIQEGLYLIEYDKTGKIVRREWNSPYFSALRTGDSEIWIDDEVQRPSDFASGFLDSVNGCVLKEGQPLKYYNGFNEGAIMMETDWYVPV